MNDNGYIHGDVAVLERLLETAEGDLRDAYSSHHQRAIRQHQRRCEAFRDAIDKLETAL